MGGLPFADVPPRLRHSGTQSVLHDPATAAARGAGSPGVVVTLGPPGGSGRDPRAKGDDVDQTVPGHPGGRP